MVAEVRNVTSEGQSPLSTAASWARVVLDAIVVIVMATFCVLTFSGGDTLLDTLLAVVFGLLSLTFAADLWRRWRILRE